MLIIKNEHELFSLLFIHKMYYVWLNIVLKDNTLFIIWEPMMQYFL